MKYILLFLLYLTTINTTAQSVIYTHRNTRLFVDEGALVVPDIGGNHHLWIVGPTQVKLQVYNQQFEWEQEQLLPLQLSMKHDITVLPFKNEYFLYNQTEARGANFFWHIDEKGSMTNVSHKLKALVRSSFTDSNIVCQLFSKGTNIFMMGHVYYPSLKKIVTTLIQTNAKLEQTFIKRYAFEFNHTSHTLRRMLLTPEGYLLVLTEHVTEERRQELRLTKINLNNNKVHLTALTADRRMQFPQIFYNTSDSSTTLFAYSYRSMVMNRLNFHTFNDTLGEKLHPTTLRVPIGEEMYGAFANISTGSGGGKWLPVHGVWNSLGEFAVVGRILVGLSSMVTLAGNRLVVMDATSYTARLQLIDPYVQNVAPPGHVKFSVVNLKSNTSTDTTFKYYRRFFIEASQFATFSSKNNDYLLVKEKFRSDGKGILLLSTNSEGKLVTSPLHLYERYHYSIPQLQQASNGSIVMPFIYKGEVGLAKVTLRPDQ